MRPIAILLIPAILIFGAPRYASNVGVAASPETPNQIVEDERGIVALNQSLRDLTNPFTVLSIAARPGDEDDGTLAYLRKNLGARTVILFATRGEGESSLMRPELDQELGVVHTREAIEAARIVGADTYFLNLRDIGRSKTAEEALSVWGRDVALKRLVRAIRALRPDIIITNHDPKSGEGVEQAIARLIPDAVDSAASAKVTPEPSEDICRVRRIFRRTNAATGGVRIDLTEYDQVRGRSYAEIGLTAHRRFASRGASLDQMSVDREVSYYKWIGGISNEPAPSGLGVGLLSGIVLSENVGRSIAQPRVGSLGSVEAMSTGERLIDALVEKLVEKRAEGTIEQMRPRYGPELVRVLRFTATLERAIALASGLSIEVRLSDTIVVPGQQVSAKVIVHNGGGRAFPVVIVTPERLADAGRTQKLKESEVLGVGAGTSVGLDLDYEIAQDAPQTMPHSSHLFDEEYYAIGSTLPGAQPNEPFGNRFLASADIGFGQVNVRLNALVRFDVTPLVEVSTIPFALVKDWSTQRDISFNVRLRNRTPGRLAGAMWVVPLALADDEYDPVHIAFSGEDEEVTIKLRLRLPILKPPLSPDVLIEFRREKPATTEPLGSAKIAVKAVDFESTPGLKIGYIRGAGDWLSTTLTELGVEYRELKPSEISVTEHGNANTSAQSRIGCADLTAFDTIVVDENAYYQHPQLLLQNRCLFRYVRQGGNLVVLGQESSDLRLITTGAQFAPYPIKLSNESVTFETASIRMTDPYHALVFKPNKITQKDFEGWVSERADNIPREWSSDYAPLLELNDPGEDLKRGSLLIAKYGEGTYVYTTLSWRRQLVAGVPGPYRMFANFLSLPKVNKQSPKPQ